MNAPDFLLIPERLSKTIHKLPFINNLLYNGQNQVMPDKVNQAWTIKSIFFSHGLTFSVFLVSGCSQEIDMV